MNTNYTNIQYINLDIRWDSVSVPNNKKGCCFCSNDPPKFCAHHKKKKHIISFSLVSISNTFGFLEVTLLAFSIIVSHMSYTKQRDRLSVLAILTIPQIDSLKEMVYLFSSHQKLYRSFFLNKLSFSHIIVAVYRPLVTKHQILKKTLNSIDPLEHDNH